MPGGHHTFLDCDGGDELVKVAFDAYDRFGYQPIYVDLVTDEPQRPVRIPSYKILSSW